MEERADRLVVEMISAGVRAGSYWAAIRKDPALTAGFSKLALKHRRRVAALADEFRSLAGERLIALAELPVPNLNR